VQATRGTMRRYWRIGRIVRRSPKARQGSSLSLGGPRDSGLFGCSDALGHECRMGCEGASLEDGLSPDLGWMKGSGSGARWVPGLLSDIRTPSS